VQKCLCALEAQSRPEYTAQFDAIYPKLAKQYGVLFYPFILDGVP